MTQQNDPLFDESNQVKNTFIKWGKFGDYIKGTLTSKRQVPSQMADRAGKLEWQYELLVDAGSYHNSDDGKIAEAPTILTKGDFVKVGGRASIDDSMRNIAIGQIVGMRYIEDGKKVKGKNPAKIVRVYRGAMNPDYMGQTAADGIQETFPGAEEVK